MRGDQVIGSGLHDRLRDARRAADGVDGDERALEPALLAKLAQQNRDGSDLVGLVGHRDLPEHEVVRGGVGRDQVQRRLAPTPVVRTPRGFAVDRDLIDRARQHVGDERAKAGRKQVRIDPVHHDPKPIGAGHAPVIGRKTAPKRQMGVPPQDDVVVVVARRDRRADHKRQNLAQRVHHLARLTRVRDGREMIQQTLATRRTSDLVHGFLPNRPEALESSSLPQRQPTTRRR